MTNPFYTQFSTQDTPEYLLLAIGLWLVLSTIFFKQ
ncbi:Uncharacterised protein [Campylobacter hyointestinalis subsp. hyointestinalis]|nr:Uncharacterised protein [Campylobacter hyointestinalis subsp. hyointestinalis]